MGFYQMTERIESGENRVSVYEEDFLLLNKYKESLKYYNIKDEKGYVLPDGMSENENVGYLLRAEAGESRYDTMTCAVVIGDTFYYEVISPKLATKKQIENIKRYLEQFYETIEKEDQTYLEYIDLASFAQKYLVEQISKNRDGNENSAYYYIPILDGDSKLYAGPVWDYDLAYGNYENNAMWKAPEGIIKLNPGLDQREDFMTYTIDMYNQICKPFLEQDALSYLIEQKEEIALSVAMDQVRWKGNPYWNGSFDTGVEQLQNFILKRMKFLDDVWNKGKIYHRVNYTDENKIVKTIYVEDGKILENYIPEQQDKNFLGWYDEDLEKEWDFEQPVTDNMALWAKWDNE